MQSASGPIVREAVASLIWLYLEPPSDASREEVESYAADLIHAIKMGATPVRIEQELRHLQVVTFCQISNAVAIRELVQRSRSLVLGVSRAFRERAATVREVA